MSLPDAVSPVLFVPSATLRTVLCLPWRGVLRAVLALMLACASAVATAAEGYRYRYVSLSQLEMPVGYVYFDAAAIDDNGAIYGVLYDEMFVAPQLAVYADGELTMLQPGLMNWGGPVNRYQVVGGGVLTDTLYWTSQAALFDASSVELIAPQPDEYSSLVTDLTDKGTALVLSDDGAGGTTYVLYKDGQPSVLDFGPLVENPHRARLNDREVVSGVSSGTEGDRGFRFETKTGRTTILEPLPSESEAWALDISDRSGDVLGYSFIPGSTERVGVWKRSGEFQTWFTQGTPEFPTITNNLLFNNGGLIVATQVSDPVEELGNSYLMPEPGVRLKLADLVENLPEGRNVALIIDINNRGDLLGLSCRNYQCDDTFLLQRLGPNEIATPAAAGTAQPAIPLQAVEMLRDRFRRLEQKSR